jgi:hypothetical protein
MTNAEQIHLPNDVVDRTIRCLHSAASHGQKLATISTADLQALWDSRRAALDALEMQDELRIEHNRRVTEARRDAA